MYRRVSRSFWTFAAICTLLTIFAAGLTMPKIAASQANPVMDAWEKARAANSYHFHSDVVQITIPSASTCASAHCRRST